MSQSFPLVAWAKGTNIYEVNIRQYTNEGTFAAFQKELPRLRDMGVEILWFMPITPISKERRQGSLGSYYACSNYTAINPEFGSMEDFKNLVSDAHGQGFKVIIDWVANHTGYDHIWTKEHPDFYKRNEQGNFYDKNGWQDVIDLDYSNKNLWKALIEAMHFWITECDIDGFRCDMAHLIPLEFWREARTTLSKVKELFWLAETEESNYNEVFDATYAWELLHTMEAIYRNEKGIKELENVVERHNTIFPLGALHAMFTTNHDENSHSGSEYERMGNAAKMFAVLCATLPNSIPLVYSGQELPNKKRLKFFNKDVIEWTGRYELHDFYKALLTLNKHNTALQGEMIRLNTTADEKVFAFVRKAGDKQVLVLLNISGYKLRFKVISDIVTGKYRGAFSHLEYDLTNKIFDVQAWDYLVYEK